MTQTHDFLICDDVICVTCLNLLAILLLPHQLLAGPSGRAYLGSCFEMFIVRTAMFEILRPD